MKEENGVFRQDLSQQEEPGGVFIMKLLFREPVSHPEKDKITDVMKKHLGEVECFWHDEKGAGVAAKKYVAQFKEGPVPVQLMVTPCAAFDGSEIDDFQRSQMWDCQEDRERILSECHYQVFGTDMMAACLPARQRAELDMNFMEALVELYPDCEAVYFLNSGKLVLARDIRGHEIPNLDRFLRFAVNVRFFNIQGTEDMLVDTLGMGILFMPDLQYHFRGMDPNLVVNHAYCTASYILENDNPIKSGDPVDGVAEGEISPQVQWKARYEGALIQPVREVIDIYMNEYAAGQRGE